MTAVPETVADGPYADVEPTDDDTLETLAGKLALVREQRYQLALVEADLVDAVTSKMTGPHQQVGRWRLDRHGGADRKGWDSPGLFSHLIRLSNVDPETGELRSDADARDELIDLVRECIPLTASLGWRAGALRKRGIHPDEWCTATSAPWRVEVTVAPVATTETTTTPGGDA